MSEGWCSPTADGIRLSVQISPNARKSEAVGLADGALKIRIHAPPVDGKANDALVRYLAAALDVQKNCITIVRGHAARRKLIAIAAAGLDCGEAQRRFAECDPAAFSE